MALPRTTPKIRMTESSFPVTDLPSASVLLSPGPISSPSTDLSLWSVPQRKKQFLVSSCYGHTKVHPFLLYHYLLVTLPGEYSSTQSVGLGEPGPLAKNSGDSGFHGRNVPGKFRCDLHINQYYISDGREQ